MTKITEYRDALRAEPDWDAYLMRESGLPGPRGNIELAQAAAHAADAARIEGWLAYDPPRAPVNTPEEFLYFCGVLGLGERLAAGEMQVLGRLRTAANDPRWRTREAVAMALQRWGEGDMQAMLAEAALWGRGTLLEKRAAAAGLCEPRLLKDGRIVRAVLDVLTEITASLAQVENRRSDDFQALRKGLAYCWSVAAAADLEAGKPAMEAWFASTDKDVRWIMKENLKKNRLLRLDPDWCLRSLDALSA